MQRLRFVSVFICMALCLPLLVFESAAEDQGDIELPPDIYNGGFIYPDIENLDSGINRYDVNMENPEYPFYDMDIEYGTYSNDIYGTAVLAEGNVPVSGYCGGEGDGTNLSWVLSDDGVLTISGKGKMKDYCSSSFYGYQDKIKSVVFESGVTSIGISAFCYCASLTTVTIPDSVTSIGINAFQYCTSLTSIFVDSNNLNYCSSDGVLFTKDMKNLIQYPAEKKAISYLIPDSVASVGDWAFSNCTGLTSVTIPDSVASIGNNAFGGCTGLTTVTIPNSVTSIGNNAFYRCIGLTSVTIPDRVSSIGNSAFFDCTGLTSVIISDSVTSIGWGAFQGCTSLTTVTIPNSVISIGDFMFSRCTSLTSVTIPDSVESIGIQAFYVCKGLTSITIPSSVTTIEKYAFFGCSGVKYISVDSDNPNYSSIEGVLFDKDASTIINYPAGKDQTAYTIPDTVITIADGAFNNCRKLNQLTIPKSITSIGDYAFAGMRSIKSIQIPDGITKIADSSFRGCSSLNSIAIPDSVTSIADYAFMECASLTTITIPANVTSIGNDAFYSCTGLTSVIIPAGTISIGNSAFYNCNSLTTITIPFSVTNIGYSAFCKCSNLTTVTIPSSVTYIGNAAFVYCFSLTSIKVDSGNSVYCDLDGVLFSKDRSMLICYPAGKKEAYYNIPAECTSVGQSVFAGCLSLASVTIPSSVTSIGSNAFCYSGINSIAIPISVKTIYSEAFSECFNLTDIYCEAESEPEGWYKGSGGAIARGGYSLSWLGNCNATIHWGYKPLYGDLNGDGIVDESETISILNIIKSIAEMTQEHLQSADYNKDGTIDIRDFNYIYNKTLNK